MSSIKKQWRSFDEVEKTDTFNKFLHREFQEDASVLEEGVSRRTFLKMMGASAALAGATGCKLRMPVQKIRPYAKMPESVTPGKPLYYATSFSQGEDVVGLLAQCHEGRPVKIEGNPEHPESNGSTSAIHQASILSLYDPDRIQTTLKEGSEVSSDQALSYIKELRAQHVKTKGRGLGLLIETLPSPTRDRLLARFKKIFPLANVYRYKPSKYRVSAVSSR